MKISKQHSLLEFEIPNDISLEEDPFWFFNDEVKLEKADDQDVGFLKTFLFKLSFLS